MRRRELLRFFGGAVLFGADTELVVEGESVIGGGGTPNQWLPTYLIALDGPAHKLERHLRENRVIARVENGRIVIDLRTVLPSQETLLLERIKRA